MATFSPRPSKRSDVSPFIVMDVVRAAADREHAGKRVVHMEIGQPGHPAPSKAVEAAHEALAHGRLGYTESLGLRPLRTRICAHYREAYGIEVPFDRVAITTGSSGGFNLALLAAFDPGARIGLTVPGYPAYPNIFRPLGVDPVTIPLSARDGFVLTPERLEQAHREHRLDGILVASPANPTGSLTPREDLKALIAAAEDLGILFISDEIYHRLVYSGDEASAVEFSDNAIVVNSFSKYYCMTGWRVGWMVLPEVLVRPVERITQSLYISAPAISQYAALGAMEASDELEGVKQGYAKNRDLLMYRLPALGFDEMAPCDGAFYVYASLRRFSNDSLDFCARMLDEAGVAATPGLDFDTERGNGTIRFSFAGSHDDMVEGMERLEGWLK